MKATPDNMIAAIRACPLVGRGTCSTVDECLTDSEIEERLAEDGIETIASALEWAHDFEECKKEQALNQRWGDDDDWQLKAWEKWQADRAAFKESSR